MPYRYAWIVRGELAQGPLPSRGDLPEIARAFKSVVSLATPREVGGLEGYLRALEGLGLRVLSVPTPDFHPVELAGLHEINLFLDSSPKPALVHCVGGLGRSGMASAARLIYLGASAYEAVAKVRAAVPGSVEALGQVVVLEDYEELLGLLGREWLAGRLAALRERGKAVQLFLELARAAGVGEGKREAAAALLLGSELPGGLAGALAGLAARLARECGGDAVVAIGELEGRTLRATVLYDSPCEVEAPGSLEGGLELALDFQPYMEYA